MYRYKHTRPDLHNTATRSFENIFVKVESRMKPWYKMSYDNQEKCSLFSTGISERFIWDEWITTIVFMLKVYLHYKMITPQNVLSEAQVKNFFIS